MSDDSFALADAISCFAPGRPLRAALFLTFGFDGAYFERIVAPDLFEREVHNCLVVRDRQAVCSEAPSCRYEKANACFSTKVFHPKLTLLVTEHRARAIVGSANLTRGGLEFNRELGCIFDLDGNGGSMHVFRSITEYLGEMVEKREVAGRRLQTLRNAIQALEEVLSSVQGGQTDSPNCYVIHNYKR